MPEQHPRKVFERVIALLKGGARGEAESLCRERLEFDPGDINFVALLGTILAEKHEFEEAAALLARAVKAAPGHAKAHEDLGTVLLNMNRASEALPHLERASSLSPENAGILNKLGGAFERLGRKEDAARCLAQAAKLSPYQAKLEEATRKFATGHFREAETMAQALVRENPRDVNAALLLARIAINANCFEDAKEILERITQMAPRFIAAWHDLGTVLKELHAFDEAVEALRTALAMDRQMH